MLKIIGIILAVVIIGFALLVFLFVRWANQPESVEYFKQKKAADAAKKLEDDKKRDDLEKELEAKRGKLKLVIDENFANNRFEFLDYKFDASIFTFEKKEFHYIVSVYKGSNPNQDFIYSKEDFGDFAAEMEFGIWGHDAKAGIFWDAQPNANDDRNPPAAYQYEFSTPNGLYVETGDSSDDYTLGSFLESATSQKVRVERFGKNLKVSVDGKVYFDKTIENAGQGKVGIYIGHRGGIQDDRQSIHVDIKSFKVWK